MQEIMFTGTGKQHNCMVSLDHNHNSQHKNINNMASN